MDMDLAKFVRGYRIPDSVLTILEEEHYIDKKGELTDLGITKLAQFGYCEHGWKVEEPCAECKLPEKHKPEVASGYKTLRDEFAMAALTGILACNQSEGLSGAHNFAKRAYQFADKMMEARDA